MHMYTKAMIIHNQYREEMEVRMQPHRENPERNNHVNLQGKWRLLAEKCDFQYTKIIRFKYMGNGEDADAREGQNTAFPIFHIC